MSVWKKEKPPLRRASSPYSNHPGRPAARADLENRIPRVHTGGAGGGGGGGRRHSGSPVVEGDGKVCRLGSDARDARRFKLDPIVPTGTSIRRTVAAVWRYTARRSVVKPISLVLSRYSSLSLSRPRENEHGYVFFPRR